MPAGRQQALKVFGLCAALLALLVLASAMMMPLLSSFIEQHFSPGLGLRDAAVIAFFVTVITLVVFAFAAGDGLLGELQYILGGFFSFFLVFWLMIAWIF
ncbi:hypothetical protein [Spongiibacter sp.]|uniref:hypothetical protein n=1 Tax=Spongiibacter sp. TaxID=2024860 RepID=UPI003566120B